MQKREICLSVKCETICEFCVLFFYFSVCPVSLQQLISPLTGLINGHVQTSEFV